MQPWPGRFHRRSWCSCLRQTPKRCQRCKHTRRTLRGPYPNSRNLPRIASIPTHPRPAGKFPQSICCTHRTQHQSRYQNCTRCMRTSRSLIGTSQQRNLSTRPPLGSHTCRVRMERELGIQRNRTILLCSRCTQLRPGSAETFPQGMRRTSLTQSFFGNALRRSSCICSLLARSTNPPHKKSGYWHRQRKKSPPGTQNSLQNPGNLGTAPRDIECTKWRPLLVDASQSHTWSMRLRPNQSTSRKRRRRLRIQ